LRAYPEVVWGTYLKVYLGASLELIRERTVKQAGSVPLSAIGSVLESVLGSVIESILGVYLGSHSVYLGAYSEYTWERTRRCT